MENNGRKRRRSSDNKAQPSKEPTPLPTSQGALRVTAEQLRELWRYDDECGRKFMKGCPLRTCSVDGVESGNDDSADDLGLTIQEMILVKSLIFQMWKQAANLFEIFFITEEEDKGYRLRVRKDLVVKLSIKQQDAMPCGWVAHIPAALSEAHVFKRSPVEPNGYLGGPVSYMNWCRTNLQQVSVLKSISNQAMCKVYTNRNLLPGTELLCNYGCNQYLPDGGVWFKDECCCVSTVHPAEQKRHGQNETSRDYYYRELCVLCGFAYSIDNKENRTQRKQHLVGLHADFLGSAWDGSGFYDQQVVEPDTLFCKADELNHLLGALKKMKWNVLPACKVFSHGEVESFGVDEEALMDEFERRKEMFKIGGTIVLRGAEVPSTSSHFKPIAPRKWKVITWKNNVKPVSGRFSVSPDLKVAHELGLSTVVSSFCKKYL